MVSGRYPNLKVTVLDFGIARVMSATRFSRTAHAMGKAQFMAPEQAAGSAAIDHRADLYSAGAVLYLTFHTCPRLP